MDPSTETQLREIGVELQTLRDERQALVAIAAGRERLLTDEERQRGQEVVVRINELVRRAVGLRGGQLLPVGPAPRPSELCGSLPRDSAVGRG